MLSELEMVCDRVAILVQGGVAMHGTLDELTRDSRRYEIVIEGGAPTWAGDDALRAESMSAGEQTKLIQRSNEAARCAAGP